MVKENGAAGKGVRVWQTSAMPIQKQEKHIRRNDYEHWIHICKNYFLDSWLSAAPRATHSFDRKHKYDI